MRSNGRFGRCIPSFSAIAFNDMLNAVAKCLERFQQPVFLIIPAIGTGSIQKFGVRLAVHLRYEFAPSIAASGPFKRM